MKEKTEIDIIKEIVEIRRQLDKFLDSGEADTFRAEVYIELSEKIEAMSKLVEDVIALSK